MTDGLHYTCIYTVGQKHARAVFFDNFGKCGLCVLTDGGYFEHMLQYCKLNGTDMIKNMTSLCIFTVKNNYASLELNDCPVVLYS